MALCGGHKRYPVCFKSMDFGEHNNSIFHSTCTSFLFVFPFPQKIIQSNFSHFKENSYIPMICIWVFYNLFFIERAWVLSTTWSKELKTMKVELKIWSRSIFIWSPKWWFPWFHSLLSFTPFLHTDLPFKMSSFGMQHSTTYYLSATLTSYIFICFVLEKLCFRYHFKNSTCTWSK